MKKTLLFEALSRAALQTIHGGGRAAYDFCDQLPCIGLGPLSWANFCKLHTDITGVLCVCGSTVPNGKCKLG